MIVLNPWGALRRERLNAAALSEALIDSRGHEHRAIVEAMRLRRSMKEVVSAASSVKSPNGTTRKILRIAENAL